MIIAFEGPDKTGKSTSAKELTYSRFPTYNMTAENYAKVRADLSGEKTITHCFDRIDWMTHMAYRLALPGYEWNDERVRTVFAAPDTHLVFKLHANPDSATDELYADGQLRAVNTMYMYLAQWLVPLNRAFNYQLFRTISIVMVDISDGFSQQMVLCDTPNKEYSKEELSHITTNEDISKFLAIEDFMIL